jgi:tetratricopeptide (TPR) repeat protein
LVLKFASIEEVASRVRELRFPARNAEAPRRVSNLPYNSLGPLFKGRDAALPELKQRLQSGSCQAIHGLGGVGKTRLAIEYAWRHAGNYTALLFASARSAVDLRTNLAGFCDPLVLNLPEQGRPEEAARLAAAFRWLNEHSGWLLILDNADTPEAAAEVEKTLPKLQGGGVIITSRIADWSAAVQTTELDVLGEQDAAAFLLERTEARRKKTASDTEDAAVLAHELGCLVLALEQAGAYIAKNSFSFSEYRRRWESTREKVLAWYDERLMQYPNSVATTWQASVDQLAPPERDLLNILAWLAPEPIPVSLLEDVPVDGADARDALSGLVSWSLAQLTADGDNFTIHRLVQEITRQRLSDNEKESALKGLIHGLLDILRFRVSGNRKESALERALQILNGKLPSPEWDQAGWRLWERLAPHCRTLLGRLRGHAFEPKATQMMNELASWFKNRAEHSEAEPLYQRALAIDEKSFGPDHPNVATGLNNLAGLLRDTNRHAEAEPLYRRALSINEKSFGPDHPKVAIRVNNLALLLMDTNRHAEAEPLYRRARLGATHDAGRPTRIDAAHLRSRDSLRDLSARHEQPAGH